MTRLERFDNRHYDENDPISRKKRLISRIILFLAVITVSIIAGSSLYIFRDPIHQASKGVSTPLQAGIKTHFADGVRMNAIVPFLRDVFTDRNSPAASPQDNPKAVGSADTFLYTVELTDGGRIKGKSITVDRETVTISDDSGVKVQVDRNRVVRITRLPL